MATPAQARLLATLRGWLGLLPARIDDARFWPRAALGLALRWLALEAEWWPLREALARGVRFELALLGQSTVPTDRAAFLAPGGLIAVTVACTHVELFALVGPALWDRTTGVARNLGKLVLVVLGLALLALVRIPVAVLLLGVGVPWLWGHDVVLGVCYFGVMAGVLRASAWARPARVTVPEQGRAAAPRAAGGASPPPGEGSG